MSELKSKVAHYAKLVLGVIAGFIVLFIVLVIALPDSKDKSTTPSPVANTASSVAPETDQQSLDDKLTGTVSAYNPAGERLSYRDLKVESADSNRPKGTKMLTVSVDAKSFLNKNSLLRDTGKLSSQLFQTAFNDSKTNAYDVIIWYYGKTTDQYGNQKDDVVLTYTLDKLTFAKINWQSFEETTLCDFLTKEDQRNNGAGDTSCITLANIQ